MISLRLTSLAALAAVALSAAPLHAESDSLAVLSTALQSAVDAADATSLLGVCARLQTLAASETKSADVQCTIALASWRVVPLLMRDPQTKDKAERRCMAGIAAADRALELNPNHAEALALKAGLEGLSLSFRSQAEMMTLGPQMEKELDQALAMAPANPRVLLIDGINTLHKPAFVGGGPDRALPKFQKAIALFEADPTSTAWGRDDAYLWAGRVQMQVKDYAAARASFAKALAANPNNGWVRLGLLPDAEKALADPSVAKAK